MSKRYKYTIEELNSAVKNSFSMAEVMRKLNILPAGGNYNTIRTLIKLHNIDISHFTGQLWNKGKHKVCFIGIPLDEILVENSTYTFTHNLKHKLYKNYLKEQVCENCGITKWMDDNISFELHHINGDRTDNRLENLKILCPNCHSQTKNFRVKNRADLVKW